MIYNSGWSVILTPSFFLNGRVTLSEHVLDWYLSGYKTALKAVQNVFIESSCLIKVIKTFDSKTCTKLTRLLFLEMGNESSKKSSPKGGGYPTQSGWLH